MWAEVRVRLAIRAREDAAHISPSGEPAQNRLPPVTAGVRALANRTAQASLARRSRRAKSGEWSGRCVWFSLLSQISLSKEVK